MTALIVLRPDAGALEGKRPSTLLLLAGSRI